MVTEVAHRSPILLRGRLFARLRSEPSAFGPSCVHGSPGTVIVVAQQRERVGREAGRDAKPHRPAWLASDLVDKSHAVGRGVNRDLPTVVLTIFARAVLIAFLHAFERRMNVARAQVIAIECDLIGISRPFLRVDRYPHQRSVA